jgi:diadenosine tetraphosphate (Ap4A) HIT family hydrolase
MITFLDDLNCQMEEICRFCRPPEKERILYQTEHFYVMVSLGPIVEGYLLIVSKEHIGACLHLPTSYLKEFFLLKDKVKSILNDVYGCCLFYEHGKTGSCLITGKDHIHCFHAHLHCVPAKVNLNEIVKDDLVPMQFSSVSECYEKMKHVEKYLYIEDSRICTYQPDIELRSQYLRYNLAKAVGHTELWDWVKIQNWELIYKTIDKIKPYFK